MKQWIFNRAGILREEHDDHFLYKFIMHYEKNGQTYNGVTALRVDKLKTLELDYPETLNKFIYDIKQMLRDKIKKDLDESINERN